jgi:hypothetical protein
VTIINRITRREVLASSERNVERYYDKEKVIRKMLTWCVWGMAILAVLLLIIIIVIERMRFDRGIVVSSDYRKVIIAGIVVMIIGAIGTVVFFIIDIPFIIGIPIILIGIAYIVAGLVYKKEWLKWLHSYTELENRYSRSGKSK